MITLIVIVIMMIIVGWDYLSDATRLVCIDKFIYVYIYIYIYTYTYA